MMISADNVKRKVRIMKYEDDFYDAIKSSSRKLVLYGMGKIMENIYPYFSEASYICDRKVEKGGSKFHDITILRPEDLEKLNEDFIVLICVKEETYREQIKDLLSHMNIDALVFEFCNNISFNYFQRQKRVVHNEIVLKKVHIVYDSDGWILHKFATKMQEELLKKGILADIGKWIDNTADINHHIAFNVYGPLVDSNNSLMITHVDSINKLNLLKHWIKEAKIGICMSRDTMNQLTMAGVPREKLCYINPAQDGVIKPKKYVLGITHRIYQDHRKRVSALLDICGGISPDYFEFKIMGSGWEELVEEVRKMGFTVTYYPEFDYDIYINLIPSLDYYLFWGFDEGSMGYLDAVAAGVKTIVTPQGFHLDTCKGLTYPCRTIPDFIDTLSKLEMERRRVRNAVSDWTWEKYTEKHIEVWKYLLGDDNVYQNKHKYEDGIFSMMCVDA